MIKSIFAVITRDWASASRECEALKTEQMVEKVLAATLKIRDNETIEQGVFQRRVHNFALIAALLGAATRGGNRVSVLDFGGSLGISYFHSRPYLRDVLEVNWSIVELPDLGHGWEKASGIRVTPFLREH